MNTSDAVNVSNGDACVPKPQHMSLAVILCLVYLLGLLLNGFSLWVFTCRIHKWNSGAVLQFNLALSDAIITPLTPLMAAYFAMESNWVFGDFACQLKIAVLSMHFNGSVIFLTLISVHRYMSVVHFNRSSLIKRKVFVKKLCAAIWCFLIITGIFYGWLLPVTTEDNHNQCLTIYQTKLTEAYFVINFVIFFFWFILPMAISVFCYSRLASSVSRINISSVQGQSVKAKSMRMIGIFSLTHLSCSRWIKNRMGKLQEFEITLNNNKTVYTPGESLTGTLKITIGQSIQCKAIKVNCQGFCGVTSKSNDTDWTEEEQYFSSSVSIADKGTLKEGEHSFPFKFLLPAAAPTSFEGPYGRIIYRVRAFIDTPRFAKDYKIEKLFSMNNTVNLNEIPGIQEPNASSITKNFSYMLVKNGTVVLKAKSDMRGYIAGQIIKVFAEIENKSDKSTGHVVASLMQKVTYNTKKPTYDLRTVAEVEGPGVKGGQKSEWKEKIIVPTLNLSTLTDGNLIQICYYIQVYLKYPEVSLTLPIYIGSTAVDPTRPSPSRGAPPMPTPRNATPAPDPDPAPSPAATPVQSASPSLPPRPAPKPAPKPRPRSAYASPSAPPADLYPELPDVASYNGEMPKRAQPDSASQAPVSPNAFSYAPGLSFRQRQSSSGPSAPPAGMSSSASLPPDYRSSAYPPEAPPSYEDSCNI
ncbi:hypothetical protein Q8A67_004239 [Cirrhinus molitorella]|uniref:G-protein coupled receptors family 1 profile domain-containing protein n=1 Tax=Cirrhinus molitorella TaxID=172907 RepID=A0AA88TX32_9TELE|nr:hypothetical protein Q8A67_004239 [Cirrhinus molitorella]